MWPSTSQVRIKFPSEGQTAVLGDFLISKRDKWFNGASTTRAQLTRLEWLVFGPVCIGLALLILALKS